MKRAFDLQRGKIDLETGRFPVTLFTNGEASDGHIIDIRGLEVGDRLPMFANHFADPTERMGGLVEPHKAGKSTRLGGASLKMTGVIDMNGDGEKPDVRRDVAQGISVGDITAMSGRWDPIKSVPRASLPESHYAFSEVSGGFFEPMFFEEARALEGSIVGVGADDAALIGRSQDLSKPAHVRNFYDVLVHGDPMSRETAIADLGLSHEEIRGLYAHIPLEDDGITTVFPDFDELEEEIETNDARERIEVASEAAEVDEPAAEEPEVAEVDEPTERQPIPIPGIGLSQDGMRRLELLLRHDAEQAQKETRKAMQRLAYDHLGRIPNA